MNKQTSEAIASYLAQGGKISVLPKETPQPRWLIEMESELAYLNQPLYVTLPHLSR